MAKKGSVRHTLQALFGLALIVLPVALKTIEHWPHMTYVVQGIGGLMTLLTNARVVFILKTLLDIFWPEDTPTESKEGGGSLIASKELDAITSRHQTLVVPTRKGTPETIPIFGVASPDNKTEKK